MDDDLDKRFGFGRRNPFAYPVPVKIIDNRIALAAHRATSIVHDPARLADCNGRGVGIAYLERTNPGIRAVQCKFGSLCITMPEVVPRAYGLPFKPACHLGAASGGAGKREAHLFDIAELHGQMKPIKNMRSIAPGGFRNEHWLGLGAVADDDEFVARIETAGILAAVS